VSGRLRCSLHPTRGRCCQAKSDKTNIHIYIYSRSTAHRDPTPERHGLERVARRIRSGRQHVRMRASVTCRTALHMPSRTTPSGGSRRRVVGHEPRGERPAEDDRGVRTDSPGGCGRCWQHWRKSSTSEARFGKRCLRRPPRPPFSAQRQAAGGGLFKYVVLYALTLVLQPVLAVVLTLAALWGLCKAFLWLIVL